MTAITESTKKPFDQHTVSALYHDLHEAAQPLTVLQGCLELALTGSLSPDDYKRSIRRALEESRRVSACFERIRSFVRTSQSQAQTAPSPEAPQPLASPAERTGGRHV